ncbi:MAG: hypothetical protein ABI639_13375 [Thermoanaerobaculia bacterium]
MSAAIEIALNAVIVAVTEEEPRLLAVHAAGSTLALPSGPLDAERDRTLELALGAWVRAQTGVELGYVEQLYTFGNRYRDPRERSGGPRVLSIAYLALVREAPLAREAGANWAAPVWGHCYDFLPWEDWRDGRPAILEREIAPALERWVRSGGDRAATSARRERADIFFGLGGAPWNGERVLDRFELLYEVGLVEESNRDASPQSLTPASAPGQVTEHPNAFPGQPPAGEGSGRLGLPLALDHRRLLASALGRLRGKLRYRPVVFELLAPAFTLLQLQRTVEALAGLRLHKQNFRRLVEQGGLVEGTGKLEAGTGGRPAELFRFRRDVLRERHAAGVGLPGLRAGG